MTIFIARDGDMIGEYPHNQLEAMARAGKLQPDDDYWHEGMGEWSTLGEFLRSQAWETAAPEERPPAPTPSGPRLDPRLLYGGIAAGALLLLVAWLFIKPDAAHEAAPNVATPPASALTKLELRDQAASDLRERLERLPSSATPPLNVFFYDGKVNMKTTYDRSRPFSATVRGSENKVDPPTGATLSRTDFVLQTDYEDGEWVFRNYSASINYLNSGKTTTLKTDATSGMPPAVVVMMGLKLSRPVALPAIVP